MPQTFVNYKASVKYRLTKQYKWTYPKARDWVKEHPDYMKAMWESSTPVDETAEFIANMQENNPVKDQEKTEATDSSIYTKNNEISERFYPR